MPFKSEFKCGIQWVCVALTPCLNTLSLHLVSYTLSKAKESAPQYHAPSLRLAGTASPHLCWRASAGAYPALDDTRRRLASGIDALFHDSKGGNAVPASRTQVINRQDAKSAKVICQCTSAREPPRSPLRKSQRSSRSRATSRIGRPPSSRSSITAIPRQTRTTSTPGCESRLLAF